MRVKLKQNLPPKPVHPVPVWHHGLFGKTFVRQHMVIDERWTPNSLIEEFKKMTTLLAKHSQFNLLDKKMQQKKMRKSYHSLQKQCRDGRSYLKRLRAGNAQEVRNILKDHCNMQRLYQKMPVHLVEENINQRTFVMRKERDRLQNRLQQLEKTYEEKLIEKSSLENRIRYENEFKLEESAKTDELRKEVEKSKLRLNAVMTINSTYKKIKQILCHDEIFHVPILRSLDADLADQSQFIKHILHLGTPALERFKELKEKYKLLDDKVRKGNRKRIMECSSYRKQFSKPHDKHTREHHGIYYRVRRYVRETKSMLELKERFEEIKKVIKTIKIATVCSNENEIFPRIKYQLKNNMKLGSQLENNMVGQLALEIKMKHASVLQGVLVNNLSTDELRRLETIEKLKASIKSEDEFEENTLLHMKSHATVYVVLRYFLWNLYNIMLHVGRRQMPRLEYPVDYLKLPLLKYEMLTMRTCPPDPFQQDISQLFQEVHQKLMLLTRKFNWNLKEKSVNALKESYCKDMLSGIDAEIQSAQALQYQIEPEIDIIEESRYFTQTVPNRDQIKLKSMRIVDEHMKKDD